MGHCFRRIARNRICCHYRVIILQEGNQQGIGAVTGVADSYFSKNKARSIDAFLSRWTKVFAAIFVIFVIALMCFQSSVYCKHINLIISIKLTVRAILWRFYFLYGVVKNALVGNMSDYFCNIYNFRNFALSRQKQASVQTLSAFNDLGAATLFAVNLTGAFTGVLCP